MLPLTKYRDSELIMRAEKALSDDPLLDMVDIGVTCQHGKVVLSGTARSSRIRDRAVETVRRAFQKHGLKYVEIADNIRLG